MIQRIFSVLRERNISPAQFAEEIGIPRSSMSHLVSGRNKPSLELIMKVLNRFPEIDAEWLLFGKEPVLKVPEAGKEISVGDRSPELPLPEELKGKNLTLFDDPEQKSAEQVSVRADHAPPEPEKSQRVPFPKPEKSYKKAESQKVIEKILVFYQDKSFREYHPEQD
jgi:transcriptional regulator with XRE-family HTH domain